jgi:4-hydroxybenzoate polyprenyltransferase
LLLWPCIWSSALAAPLGNFPDVFLMAKFALGAFVMRGAGCTINDLWDKEFDKHVERTRSRPLASGALSVKQALGFLSLQLCAGFAVLVSLNAECVLLSLASMPLVVAYPLMKRYTNWPQLVLGLTFNWGALVGWTAAAGSPQSILVDIVSAGGDTTVVGTVERLLDLSVAAASRLPVGLLESALPLYGAGVCWTLVYDTLYGYQDRKDDRRIGEYPLCRALSVTRTAYYTPCAYCSPALIVALHRSLLFRIQA